MVAALHDAGYPADYGIRDDAVYDEATREPFPPETFAVHALYRFEGITDPDDEALVLALEHLPSGRRGVLVAGYGAETAAAENAILPRLLDRRPRR